MSQSLNKNFHKLSAELEGTQLLAVSKYSGCDEIVEVYKLGQRDFGENRVQSLEVKAQEVLGSKQCPNIRWHFIGPLQSNKISKLLKIPHLYAIHSVGSLEKLQEINKRMEHFNGGELSFFLQVNTSHEEEKQGFESYEELQKTVEKINLQKFDSRLRFKGLMTMGALRSENFETSARECFQTLRKWRDQLIKEFAFRNLELSMGMSQDYKMAMEEGSDWVRIGSLLFKS